MKCPNMIAVPLFHPLFYHSDMVNVLSSHPLIPVMRNTRLPLILVQLTNLSMLLESTVWAVCRLAVPMPSHAGTHSEIAKCICLVIMSLYPARLAKLELVVRCKKQCKSVTVLFVYFWYIHASKLMWYDLLTFKCYT